MEAPPLMVVLEYKHNFKIVSTNCMRCYLVMLRLSLKSIDSIIFTSMGVQNKHMPRAPIGANEVIFASELNPVFLLSTANILTVIILSQLVARRQKSSYNYLLALAAADILVLFFIVFVDFLLEDFILNMQMPQVPDKIIEVLEFSSIHTSIWITVPLTIDRYIAVCHPLKYHTVSYPARTRKVIVSVYITCFLTSIPYYWWPNIWTEDYISTSVHHVLIWIHCFTVYLVPCSIFFILNSIIVYKLRRKSNFRLRGYSTGKTTAILFTITSIFATLWAPRIIMILYHLYGAPIQNRWLVHIMSDIANMLALLNTAINFFLYCFISKRFRTMAAATLKAFFKCQKQPVQFYTNHNFSITSSPWISPANSHCIKMLVYQYDKNGKPIKVSP
nr:putative G-protein coupled receptor [Homo sapiens]